MDPQRHTLRGLLYFTRISYPADPLGMVSVEKSKAEQLAQTRYTHRRNQVRGQSIRKGIFPSAPCQASLNM